MTIPLANRNLKLRSRQLRKEMTAAEHRLWSRIRMKQLGGYQFYRQRVIGEYIVDFYCHKARLAIEIDGSQHYTHDGVEKDRKRDKYMRNHDITVIRFTNADVLMNMEGVIHSIVNTLGV
jgi:very-short-patch-repair endonuclease